MKECTEKIISKAKKNNADVDVLISESEFVSVKARKNKIEMIERSNQLLINFRLLKDKRCTSVSCNNKEEVEQLLEKGLDSIKYVPEDEHIKFASNINIESDLTELSVNKKDIDDIKEYSKKADEYGLSVSGIRNTNGSTFECSLKKITYANSNGMLGSYNRKSFGASTEFIAEQNGQMNPGGEYIIAEKLEKINPTLLAKTAVKKALRGLNAKKIATCKVDVIFEADCAGSLLRNLASSINAESVNQSSTFLKDKLGKKILPSGTWVIDDPFNIGVIKFGKFDCEGFAKKENILVKDGVLNTWILDGYNASKLGLRSNGMAQRSPSGVISPSVSNLYIKSDKDIKEDEIIFDIKNGLYVTDVFGFGVNIVTGDYSQGAKGLWIENGKITFPVSEITISGNLGKMFNNLVIANNLNFKGYTTSPTLFVGQMTVGGK